MDKNLALIVDDLAGVRTLLSLLCQEEGMEVATADNGMEAITQVKSRQPSLVIMDIRMPVMDGVKAAEWLKNKYPQLPIILMTAYTSQERLDMAQQLGVEDIWFKPFDIDVIRQKLKCYREQIKRSLA